MKPGRHAGRGPARVGAAGALLLGLLGLACTLHSEIDPDLPRGALLSGDAVAFGRLLARLERLEGTPLGKTARLVRVRLEGCSTFEGLAADGDLLRLIEVIECRDGGEQSPAVRRLRGEDDVALLVPVGGAGRLAGSLRVHPDGSVTLRAQLDLPADGAARFILPGVSPLGPPRLATRDALLHARFRPEAGLDLASLVPRGSQGDRLFRLRVDLFAGAVLEGIWEAGVYLPPEGHRMTPVAVAVDFRIRGAAVRAMEVFIEELESTWPVHRTPFAVGAWEGACLLDLRILPEFAPCYVATDRALVVGWNPPSVRLALAAPVESESEPGRPAAGGIVVHLGRFAEADRRLRESVGPALPPLDLDYGWEQLEARTWRDGGRVWVHAALRVGGAP